MNTTMSKMKQARPARRSSAELRQDLEAAEGRKRIAARMLDDGEPGGVETFEQAESDIHRLTAQIERAMQREAEESSARHGAAREATARRLAEEAKAYSLEQRDRVAAEVVAEALDLEARLDALAVLLTSA